MRTLAAGALFAGCLSAPSSEALLAVGFRTPEQTFRSFQTALRADLVDLEYRCLSSGFKHAHGVSQLVYDTARERLFEEQPLIKWVARAEILDVEPLSAHRVRLTARVDALFTARTFVVYLVREEFYETFDAEGRLEDGYVPWTTLASVAGDTLRLCVPMPEGTSLDEIVELRAGSEWKLDGFDSELAERSP